MGNVSKYYNKITPYNNYCSTGFEEIDKNSSENEEGSDDEEEITYFEESSESEPELECDLWDNDCCILSHFTVSREITASELLGIYQIKTLICIKTQPSLAQIFPYFRSPHDNVQK